MKDEPTGPTKANLRLRQKVFASDSAGFKTQKRGHSELLGTAA